LDDRYKTVRPICNGTVVYPCLCVMLSCWCIVAKRLDGWIKMPLGTEIALGRGDIVRWRLTSPNGKGHFSAHVFCVAHLSNYSELWLAKIL